MTKIEALEFIKSNRDMGISVVNAAGICQALGITMDLIGLESVAVQDIYNAFIESLLLI